MNEDTQKEIVKLDKKLSILIQDKLQGEIKDKIKKDLGNKLGANLGAKLPGMFNKTSGSADNKGINRVEKEVMHIKATIDATKEEMAATKEELMVAMKANSEATMLAFNQLADKLAKTE